MQVTRESLLDNLYSAFDKAPDEVIALRIGSGGALQWAVTADKLTVTDSNQLVTDIALTGTLLEVLNALRAAGIEIKYVNSDVLHLSAGVLLKGSGNEASSNGDQLKIFMSPLWAIMDSYAVELSFAEQQIVEAIADLYINTATGEILDYWGEYFGCARLNSETDTVYRTRMIYEILQPKSNKYALTNAVKAVFGYQIDIYEPWTDLFALSDSHLDTEHMYDGDIWSPYVFRPIVRGQNNIKWQKVLALLNKIRPAAVFPLAPEWVPDVRGIEHDVEGFGLARAGYAFYTAIYADKTNLDDYHLGDPIVMNYRISQYDLYGLGNYALDKIKWGGNWGDWDDRQWGSFGPEIIEEIPGQEIRLRDKIDYVRAQIVLSDMDEPLGDLRVRFPMATYTERKSPKLDDYVLSHWDDGYRVIPVEDVYWPNHAAGFLVGKAGSICNYQLNEHFVKAVSYQDNSILSLAFMLSDIYSFGNFSAKGIKWDGGWDDRPWNTLANFKIVGDSWDGDWSDRAWNTPGDKVVDENVFNIDSFYIDSALSRSTVTVLGASLSLSISNLQDNQKKYLAIDGVFPQALIVSNAVVTSELLQLNLGNSEHDLGLDQDVMFSGICVGLQNTKELFAQSDMQISGFYTQQSEHIVINSALPESSPVVLTATTSESMMLNPTLISSSLIWSGSWGSLPWSETVNYSGIYITISTENQ